MAPDGPISATVRHSKGGLMLAVSALAALLALNGLFAVRWSRATTVAVGPAALFFTARY